MSPPPVSIAWRYSPCLFWHRLPLKPRINLDRHGSPQPENAQQIHALKATVLLQKMAKHFLIILACWNAVFPDACQEIPLK